MASRRRVESSLEGSGTARGHCNARARRGVAASACTLLVVAVLGCNSDDDGQPDAGTPGAEVPDAQVDAGVDAGPPDAGCIDQDGDGRSACDDADCDDANPNVWAQCDSCQDQDGDGYWTGCDAYVLGDTEDCDDARSTCSTDCADADDDGTADCAQVTWIESIGARGDAGHFWGASAVVERSEGDLLIAGNAGLGGVSLARLDRRGQVLWERADSPDDPVLVVQDAIEAADGDFVVAGELRSQAERDAYASLVRYAPDGSVRWQRAYPGAGGARQVAELSDGGFVFVGQHAGDDGFDDILVVRVDADGHLVWQQSLGNPGYDDARSVLVDGAETVVVGTTHLEPSQNTVSVWLVRLDADGEVVSQTAYDTRWSSQRGALLLADGSLTVVGSASFPPFIGTTMLRVDSTALPAWSVSLDGGADASSVVETHDGGFVMVGSVSLPDANATYAAFIKLNSDGTLAWQRATGGFERSSADNGVDNESFATDAVFTSWGAIVALGQTGYSLGIDRQSPDPTRSENLIASLGAQGEVLDAACADLFDTQLGYDFHYGEETPGMTTDAAARTADVTEVDVTPKALEAADSNLSPLCPLP